MAQFVVEFGAEQLRFVAAAIKATVSEPFRISIDSADVAMSYSETTNTPKYRRPKHFRGHMFCTDLHHALLGLLHYTELAEGWQSDASSGVRNGLTRARAA
jgi:hypothetical protein